MDKLTPVESEISKAGGKALSLPTDVGEAGLRWSLHEVILQHAYVSAACTDTRWSC